MTTNQNIGDIECPICKRQAHVRQYKQRSKVDTVRGGSARYAGLLYIYCPHGCGKITTANQDWIKSAATLTETPPPPPPEPAPDPVDDDPLSPPANEPTAPVEPNPAPAKKGFMDGWL